MNKETITIPEAIDIVEGFIECEDEKKLNQAWQLLIDTGVCWKLQGWFGRCAMRLIEEGICTRPIDAEEAMWRMWGDQ